MRFVQMIMRLKSYLHPCLFLGFFLVLVGCQNIRPDNLPVATEQEIADREARLAAFKPWRAFGSMVIDSEEEGIFNVSFAWDVAVDGFEIKLFGPLGLQQYQLSEDTNGAVLIADGEKQTGFSSESLLQQSLGIEIPLRRMQSWVVGLPADAQEIERDQRGRLSRMIHVTDSEWQIEFQRYRQFEDLDLPRSILVAGDDVEIRLSIKKWLKPDEANNGRLVIPGVGT